MRIKRGQVKRQKHKKILDLAKGYRMSYHKLYRRAKEAVLHAGQYNYAHRKHRKAQLRTDWIKIISSALASQDISYNTFISQLKIKNIIIDRKNMAELITYNSEIFDNIVKEVVS